MYRSAQVRLTLRVIVFLFLPGFTNNITSHQQYVNKSKQHGHVCMCACASELMTECVQTAGPGLLLYSGCNYAAILLTLSEEQP